MQKIASFLLFSLLVLKGYGQNNNLIIGFDCAFHSYYDQFAPLLSIRYERTLQKKWHLGFEFNLTGDSYKGGPSKEQYPLTQSDLEGNYPFGFFPDRFDYGFKQFPTHSAKFIYLNGDIDMNYMLLKKKKHSLSFGTGPSLLYVDKQYISLVVQGEFESFINPKMRVSLTVPYYLRFLDLGYHAHLDYKYQINERTAIGTRLDRHQFIYSGEYFTTLGSSFIVNF
jgi:hypothetical protein